jgi:hypothetical protein
MKRHLPYIILALVICLYLLAHNNFAAAAFSPRQDYSPAHFFNRQQPGTQVSLGGNEGEEGDSPGLFEFYSLFNTTETPTPTQGTPIPAIEPTKKPRPTPTPVFVPPPSDPEYLRLMIALGVIMVAILLFGIWINRKHRA